MAKYIYPSKTDLQNFIEILKEENYSVKKYLPPTSEKWYETVSNCIQYVESTSHYENLSFVEICARILYKVAKRHELGDGNKRSAVIAVYLFCILNDHYILKPLVIKQQAKRVATTKGRINETTMRKRIAKVLENILRKIFS